MNGRQLAQVDDDALEPRVNQFVKLVFQLSRGCEMNLAHRDHPCRVAVWLHSNL
ncbi:MAG TPA: hypothetical protein VIX82_12765 [Solirubrobacteraceae bacterium]